MLNLRYNKKISYDLITGKKHLIGLRSSVIPNPLLDGGESLSESTPTPLFILNLCMLTGDYAR